MTMTEDDTDTDHPRFNLYLSGPERHRRGKDENRRECVTVTYDDEPMAPGCTVSLTLHPSFGNHLRWIELTPAEARELAAQLEFLAGYAEEWSAA